MKMLKKALIGAGVFGPVVSALAEGAAYTTPQEVSDAVTHVKNMSTALAGTAAPAVLEVAGPWLAIGVIFFLIGIAWSFFRGRKK